MMNSLNMFDELEVNTVVDLPSEENSEYHLSAELTDGFEGFKSDVKGIGEAVKGFFTRNTLVSAKYGVASTLKKLIHGRDRLIVMDRTPRLIAEADLVRLNEDLELEKPAYLQDNLPAMVQIMLGIFEDLEPQISVMEEITKWIEGLASSREYNAYLERLWDHKKLKLPDVEKLIEQYRELFKPSVENKYRGGHVGFSDLFPIANHYSKTIEDVEQIQRIMVGYDLKKIGSLEERFIKATRILQNDESFSTPNENKNFDKFVEVSKTLNKSLEFTAALLFESLKLITLVSRNDGAIYQYLHSNINN